MQNLKGRVAVITGAASGIGLGMAREFARNGMLIALCDRRTDALAKAVGEVNDLGGRAIGLEVDVADMHSLEIAAARVEAEFGRIDVACNNAGIAILPRPVNEFTHEDWEWIIGVNLYGVINGVKAFLPRIQKHGEGGHIVNTSSIGGFQVAKGRRTAAYAATKYAVLAFSEGLHNDLEDSNIGVSVLAPSAVDTGIYKASEYRPERFGGPLQGANVHVPDLSDGLHPDAVGRRVLRAIRNRELYVFTHLETRDRLARRHARIIQAVEATEEWLADEAAAAARKGEAT